MNKCFFCLCADICYLFLWFHHFYIVFLLFFCCFVSFLVWGGGLYVTYTSLLFDNLPVRYFITVVDDLYEYFTYLATIFFCLVSSTDSVSLKVNSWTVRYYISLVGDSIICCCWLWFLCVLLCHLFFCCAHCFTLVYDDYSASVLMIIDALTILPAVSKVNF